MTTGWVKLHRSIMHSDTFSCLTLIQQMIAIYIILNANHKDGFWYDKIRGEKVEIKRGQLITSRNKMYTEWFKKDKDISEKKIRTALDKLEKLDFLAKETTKSYTKLTVLNYNVYQSKDEDVGQTEGQAKAKQGPSEGQVRAINKNEKNVKNEKNTIINNVADDRKDVFDFFSKNGFGSPWGNIIGENINQWIDDFVENGSSEQEACRLVKRAIYESTANNVRKWAYAESILRSWENKGVTTSKEVDSIEAERQAKLEEKVTTSYKKSYQKPTVRKESLPDWVENEVKEEKPMTKEEQEYFKMRMQCLGIKK